LGARRTLVLAVAFAALVLGLVWSLGGRIEVPSDPRAPSSRGEVTDSASPGAEARGEARSRVAPSERAAALLPATASRQARREAILDAARARDDRASKRAADAASESAPMLRDRIGGKGELVAAMSQDLMPLVDACIEAALEREPGLQGMLGVDLVLVADPELGAVVESAEFPEANEIGDPALLECVRHSALSTLLPPPLGDEREQVLLTRRVGRPRSSGENAQ
jgi:hypothetical protein